MATGSEDEGKTAPSATSGTPASGGPVSDNQTISTSKKSVTQIKTRREVTVERAGSGKQVSAGSSAIKTPPESPSPANPKGTQGSNKFQSLVDRIKKNDIPVGNPAMGGGLGSNLGRPSGKESPSEKDALDPLPNGGNQAPSTAAEQPSPKTGGDGSFGSVINGGQPPRFPKADRSVLQDNRPEPLQDKEQALRDQGKNPDSELPGAEKDRSVKAASQRIIEGQKKLGKVSNQLWWIGFDTSAAVFFTGFDFMMGALMMDIYWIGHRKNKDLLPMKAWQKVATVFANIAPLLYCILFLIIFFAVTCTNIASRAIIIAAGGNQICTAVDSAASGVAYRGLPGSLTGTNTNTFSGPLSTGQWAGQINKYSQLNNIDACILKTIVQKESNGNPSAIGYDNDPNRGSFQLTSPPKYDLDWGYSHGIGLTQWTIFPISGSNQWVNAQTPSRNILGQFYTVADFLNCGLDSNTDCLSLALTAKIFSNNLSKNGGDPQKAFGDYNGSGKDGKYAQDSMVLYNLCKTNP